MSLTAFRPHISVVVSRRATDAVEIGRGFFTKKSPEYLSHRDRITAVFVFSNVERRAGDVTNAEKERIQY